MSLSESLPRVRPTNSRRASPWQAALRDGFRDPTALLQHLGLPADLAGPVESGGFATLVPRGFADRMRPGDPDDPLLLQVLPDRREFQPSDLPHDVVGDMPAQRAAGLIQKYAGRALLTLAGQCAVNCRYCFRRHFPYETIPKADEAWEPALRQIEADAGIRELILSGGDPLMLGDNRLSRLFRCLGSIPHVDTVRIHTRLPVVVPERVTDDLVTLLGESHQQRVVVLHINHANELDAKTERAIGRLRSTGGLVMNQSVLLRRVNDSVEALENLSRRLLACGVLPYYLHQLDLVAGVQHFHVPEEEGRRLIEQLRKRLPGYAVPRYVREDAGAVSKTVLA